MCVFSIIVEARADMADFVGSVAELADAADLKSAAFGLVGSNPTAPTI